MDLVECVTQSELFDRRGHPSGHRPAHPAALDHECDPATIRPRSRPRPFGTTPQQGLYHRVAAPVFGRELGRPKRVRREAPLEHEPG